MRRALTFVLVACVAVMPAFGQTTPAPPPPATPQKPAQPAPPKPATAKPATPDPDPIRLRAFATFGSVVFHARESFETSLESSRGPVYGGGGQLLLPWGLYAEVGAWHFSRDGERVFIGPNQEVFRLGIPLSVTITPMEITGGWRYRHCPRPARAPGAPRTPQPARTAAPPRACVPRVVPYAGAGFSSYRYKETSEFSAGNENVDARFNGYHIVGGAEYRLHRWIALGGEVAWSTIPDALDGGVAAAFDEHNLGGTTIRLKVSFGR